MRETVHLQGVGIHGAISAGQLRVGMHIVYNFGCSSEVTNVTPTKSGKSIAVDTRADDGQIYTRKYRSGSLVAVKEA